VPTRAVTIAAGMWPPETAQQDARAALLPVASSLKALLASVEAVRSLQMSEDVRCRPTARTRCGTVANCGAYLHAADGRRVQHKRDAENTRWLRTQSVYLQAMALGTSDRE